MHEILTSLAELIKLQAFWITASGAIAGAMAGATASSFFSYRIQRHILREEEKFRNAEFRKSQQALGRSLIIKLGKMHSSISTVHEHIEESFRLLERSHGKMPLWGSLRPLAYIPDPVRFSSDELSMLMSLGDEDFFNRVLNVEPVHDSLLGAMRVYGPQRQGLLNSLPVSYSEGTVAGACMDSKDLTPALRAQMEAIDSFIVQMHRNAKRAVSESAQALNDLTKQLQVKLDLQRRVEFIGPNAPQSSG